LGRLLRLYQRAFLLGVPDHCGSVSDEIPSPIRNSSGQENFCRAIRGDAKPIALRLDLDLGCLTRLDRYWACLPHDHVAYLDDDLTSLIRIRPGLEYGFEGAIGLLLAHRVHTRSRTLDLPRHRSRNRGVA